MSRSTVYGISKEYGIFMVSLVQSAFIPGFNSFPQRNSKQKQKLINSIVKCSKQKQKCEQGTSVNFIKLVSVVLFSLLKYLFILLNGKYIKN